MPSALPSPRGPSRKVKDFGLGPYLDSVLDSMLHGEDDEEQDVTPRSLPDDGGPTDPFGPERLIGYPSTPRSAGPSILPGDQDRPPSNKGHWRAYDPAKGRGAYLPEPGSYLPQDDQNPPARSDYYDQMTTGEMKEYIGESDYWADEDAGAYAKKRKTKQESIPVPAKNDITMDNFLNALGNFWTGYSLEDLDQSYGFPSMEFKENVSYPKSNQDDLGGTIVASDYVTGGKIHKATNIKLVEELTSDFVKKYGKKDLTRRHVLAFLQDAGHGYRQYIASDIIRCLKLNYGVYIKDVMDEFPVKIASAAVPSFPIQEVGRHAIFCFDKFGSVVDQSQIDLRDIEKYVTSSNLHDSMVKNLITYYSDMTTIQVVDNGRILTSLHGKIANLHTANLHDPHVSNTLFECATKIAGLARFLK